MVTELHPIVAQLAPSPEQLPAVVTRGRDVVVTAGAGAGKTRTLVARYLSLLADGCELRGIIAITFTRKAARELRNRVRQEIRRYLQDGPADARRWEALYYELDAARIGTIHSLCGEIIRAHPAEAGVDPRFETLDETEMRLLQSDAVTATLAWAVDDPACVALYDHWSPSMLRELLQVLLEKRLDVESAFASLPADLWVHWQRTVRERCRPFIESSQMQVCIRELQELEREGILAHALREGDPLAGKVRAILDLWQAAQRAMDAGDWIGAMQHLQAVPGEIKLNMGRAANWQSRKPTDTLRELRELYESIWKQIIGSGTVDTKLDKILVQTAPLVRRLFEHAAGLFARYKQERQALDFDDLESFAVQLLRDEEVRTYWRAQVAAILVDEYQDTNGRQRDLVNALNGPGGNRLFIVGDAKQSIYRFRGADVTVFREERQRIRDSAGLRQELPTSYRAHANLVACLNTLLEPVLGSPDTAKAPWREPFAPLKHFREQPRPGLVPPFVQLHLTLGTKTDGALVEAARFLGSYLIELASDPDLHCDFGDMALLCRASSSFSAYEEAFSELNIPYLTVAGKGFYARPEVRDLLNALQAIAEPEDDLAMAGLLRSPVIGWDDAELAALGGNGRGSWWHRLASWQGARAAFVVDLVTRLHAQVGRRPVADLLKMFVDETDYLGALRQAGEMRAARNVLKLLSAVQQSALVSVGEFLHYVQNLRDAGAREGEAPATAEGAVRIMSVHAAKGLEFPVVVLGDVTYGSRNRTPQALIHAQVGVLPSLKGPSGAAPTIFQIIQQQDQDQEAAELERLLYVAATRAKDLLLINGCVSLSPSRKPKLGGWLSHFEQVLGVDELVPDFNPEGARAHRVVRSISGGAVGCIIYEPNHPLHAVDGPQPPVVAGRAEGWTQALLASYLGNGRADAGPPRRVWQVVPAAQNPSAPAWVVGSIVHEALSHWRFPNGDGLFSIWAEARARSFGITEPVVIRDGISRVKRLLANLQAHALYGEIEAAQPRLHELPYSISDGNGGVENGKIDILYRLPDGRWKLVDFKTDEVEEREDIPQLAVEKAYDKQIRRYALAVKQLTGELPELSLCMLNCGRRAEEWVVEG